MQYSNTQVELDFTGKSRDTLDAEGGAGVVIPEGRYHLLITHAAIDQDGTCLRVHYLTLAGTNPKGVGLTGNERFYLSKDAQKRLEILTARLDLIGTGEYGRRKAVDFAPIIGRE